MATYTADRRLPLEALPDQQRTLGEKAIAAHDARERKAADAGAQKAQAAAEQGERQLRDRIGARKFAALREVTDRERRALRALREPPGGLGLDVARAKKARARRIAAEARKLGVDPKTLHALGVATAERVLAGLGTPAGTVSPGYSRAHNLAHWAQLSPLHQHPLDGGPRPPLDPAPDAFEVFGPDFDFWNTAFTAVESRNFRVRREYTLFEHSGAVGNIATMDCDDAGSFDYASAQVDTEVVFIFEARRAGRVEVIIDAMNAFSHNDLRIEDEWGWSEHWTHQLNYLSLNVFHPAVTERSLALMAQFDAEGNEDRTWSSRPLTPGAHYYGHCVANGAVQAGDTFFVGVGTRTFDITRANDVEVHSRSNFYWWVRSVEVRVVP